MDKDNKTMGPTTYTGTINVNVRGRDYYVHMSAPLPMMTLADLEEGLVRNRTILRDCQDKMRNAFEQEAFEYAAPWVVNYDAPTQDAIQAHLNINMLIPLINLKGGNAIFEKTETLPVQQRLEIMRNVAEKSVFLEHMHHYNSVNRSIIVTFLLLVLLSLVLL